MFELEVIFINDKIFFMTLLNFFFIISWIIILFLAFDIAKKQKFNALHFLVFIAIWWWLLTFTFFPNILDNIWSIFWVARWADVLVYSSIVFLLYFVLLLLRKVEDNSSNITILIREIAIRNSKKENIKWKEVFLIRVYNEELVLEETLNKLIDKWYKNLLVVNDWSTDSSFKILEKYGDKIFLLNHYKNRWWWAALETWFEYIRRFWETDYVVTFDADWQHDIKDLKTFYDLLDKHKNIDIVLWSRFIKKTNTNVWVIRKIILKLWIIFTFFVSNIKLTDSHNWYRVFRTKVIKKIRLTMDDMSYASELIDIISNKDIPFKEVPVNIKYTEYSLSKGQKSSNAINIAFRMIWSKFFR